MCTMNNFLAGVLVGIGATGATFAIIAVLFVRRLTRASESSWFTGADDE